MEVFKAYGERNLCTILSHFAKEIRSTRNCIRKTLLVHFIFEKNIIVAITFILNNDIEKIF